MGVGDTNQRLRPINRDSRNTTPLLLGQKQGIMDTLGPGIVDRGGPLSGAFSVRQIGRAHV